MVRRAPLLLLAVTLGLAIWIASPWLTGRREPWDAESPYYVASLFLTGAVTGLVAPRWFWLGPIGIGVGQLAALLAGPRGPLLPLGLLFLAGFTLVALVGAALGAAVAAALRRRSKGVA